MSDIEREFLLTFWKVHILHHAAREPVVGAWIMKELARHGYFVSPGSLYPLLARMEQRGWLACSQDLSKGIKSRKEYTLTPQGHLVLDQLRAQVAELYREVVLGEATPAPEGVS